MRRKRRRSHHSLHRAGSRNRLEDARRADGQQANSRHTSVNQRQNTRADALLTRFRSKRDQGYTPRHGPLRTLKPLTPGGRPCNGRRSGRCGQPHGQRARKLRQAPQRTQHRNNLCRHLRRNTLRQHTNRMSGNPRSYKTRNRRRTAHHRNTRSSSQYSSDGSVTKSIWSPTPRQART